MGNAFAVHDIDSILDYGFDWTDWLPEDGTIVSSTWTGPDGVTLSQGGTSGPITVIRVQVTDEALIGVTLSLVNSVVASDGQQDDRTLKLYVQNR